MSSDRCRAARNCPDPPRPGRTTCERHGAARRKASSEYQARHRKKGFCVECASTAEPGASRCQRCLLTRRLAVRAKNGSAAWKPGGRGRPPFFRDREVAQAGGKEAHA